MARPPIRIGVLADAPEVQGELAPALQRAMAEGIGEVVAIIVRTVPDEPAAMSRLQRHWRHRGTLLFRILSRLDGARRGLPQAAPPVPITELAPGARRLPVTPVLGRFTDRISDPDVAAIRDLQLDVLIRGGFRVLTGEILTAAKHGILSFHHGDNRSNRGGPAGVWEVLEDVPTTGVVLQQLTDELDGGPILARALGATQRFSFHRNRVHALRRTSAMLFRSLARLHEGRSPRQDAVGGEPSWSGYARPLFRAPTNRQILRYLPRLLGRYVRQRLRSLRTRNQWQVAWHWDATAEGQVPASVLRRYRFWDPPADRFWADPFPASDGGRHWVFLEELRYASGKGTIAVVEFDAQGPVETPVVVLEEPWHLSYPYIFRHEGQWYMLPESGSSKQTHLYRATAFPHRWERHGTILDGAEVFDATLHQADGTWYLFCSLAQDGIAPDEELHLFWAEAMEGPYRPHPANPLVTDVSRARMAGRLFQVGNELYRPAQNCAPHYGAGIALQRVLELSRTAYREATAQELAPDWDVRSVGMHTLNADGPLSTLDLLRRIPR